MKVKAVEPFEFDGEKYEAGEVVDMPHATARRCVASGLGEWEEEMVLVTNETEREMMYEKVKPGDPMWVTPSFAKTFLKDKSMALVRDLDGNIVSNKTHDLRKPLDSVDVRDGVTLDALPKAEERSDEEGEGQGAERAFDGPGFIDSAIPPAPKQGYPVTTDEIVERVEDGNPLEFRVGKPFTPESREELERLCKKVISSKEPDEIRATVKQKMRRRFDWTDKIRQKEIREALDDDRWVTILWGVKGKRAEKMLLVTPTLVRLETDVFPCDTPPDMKIKIYDHFSESGYSEALAKKLREGEEFKISLDVEARRQKKSFNGDIMWTVGEEVFWLVRDEEPSKILTRNPDKGEEHEIYPWEVPWKLNHFEWIKVIWECDGPDRERKILCIRPFDIELKFDESTDYWPERPSAGGKRAPISGRRSASFEDKYDRNLEKAHEIGKLCFLPELEGTGPVRPFEGLEKARRLILKHNLTPDKVLFLTLALTKYEPGAEAPYSESDVVSCEEFIEKAWTDIHQTSPKPRGSKIFYKIAKPLVQERLIHYAEMVEETEHPRFRLTASGYRLFFPDFDEEFDFDRAGEIHRRAAKSLAFLGARRDKFPLVTIHGIQEMTEGRVHADVPLIPRNKSKTWASERHNATDFWSFDLAVMGQVVRDPSNNPDLVKEAVKKAVERRRRVCFAAWSKEMAERIRRLAAEELPKKYSIGVGLEPYPDQLVLIQPIPLFPLDEQRKYYLEKPRKYQERAKRALATEETEKEIKKYGDDYKIYNPGAKEDGGKKIEHLGRANDDTIRQIVEDRSERRRWATVFEPIEDPSEETMEEFEELVEKELKKPKYEQDIFPHFSPPAFVGVARKTFPGEAFIYKYAELEKSHRKAQKTSSVERKRLG